ncbi:glycosyltransferase family 4 protein [Aerococcus sp. UMB8623]|uniref:glycosyltransferase family 4 protein n=1 Tax=Aerococcus sp. UMB8623 TaxID=3046348 RepID=UPI00254E26DB|nr:glycosyltransferase family 4 protein [Aerococcus sp. UMB8623]MDK6687200.1 glycosyltransferase family 4 protein [Aerococcus sp. UMB8623]
MKKALMYASVASMIDMFNMNNIEILKDLGYQVDVACNFEDRSTTTDAKIEAFKQKLHDLDVSYYHLPIPRQMSKIGDIIKSYQLSKKLAEKNYDLVHCHSPIGAALCRLAFRQSRTKVIYTAHGFHFYDGAPLKNWLIFYPVEKILARYTDILITINQEDYERAKGFKAPKVEYVPGIGIDIKKSKNGEIASNIRTELGINDTDMILLSIGELNDNKNHKVVIEALNEVNKSNIHYVICGEGPNHHKLEELALQLGLDNNVHILGFRADIASILKQADIFVFPSKREGLPVSLMEAMAAGLPCIVSDVRGNKDLIVGDNEIKFSPYDIQHISNSIVKLSMDKKYRERLGDANLNRIEMFSSERVKNNMKQIYLV